MKAGDVDATNHQKGRRSRDLLPLTARLYATNGGSGRRRRVVHASPRPGTTLSISAVRCGFRGPQTPIPPLTYLLGFCLLLFRRCGVGAAAHSGDPRWCPTVRPHRQERHSNPPPPPIQPKNEEETYVLCVRS
ncbi:unnamed protein product [Musa acuminata var. zebrina]